MVVNKLLFTRIFIVTLLLGLPYYLFFPHQYIGGDDSRIFTVFPKEFLQQIAPYSWMHFSTSLGLDNPNQFFIPLTSIALLLHTLIPLQTPVSYLLFSLPLILGFLFFEQLTLLLLPAGRRAEAMIAAAAYVTSPIMIIMQWSIFLTAVWLIGLVPALMFLCLRYVKTKKVFYIFIACMLSIILSVGLSAIPWLVGFLLVFAAASPLILILNRKPLIPKKEWALRISIFLLSVAVVQSFWLLPFLHSVFTNSPNDIGTSVAEISKDQSFQKTVDATAVGTIVHPVANLFHKQIAQNFQWKQLAIFTSYYDYLIWVNLAFPALFLLGLYYGKKSLFPQQYKILLIVAWIYAISLFFFTINIGELKHIFIKLGRIPGWVMFRNSFDKFAPVYVFSFSLLLALSLSSLKKHSQTQKTFLYGVPILLIILNALPIKDLINRPLWTTDQSYSNTIIPSEYLAFMEDVKSMVPATANILSLPLNNAGYSIIPTEDPHRLYIGRSLVEVFSRRNDFSGILSFHYPYRQAIEQAMSQRDFPTLISLLQQLNIRYIITTKIPEDIQASYLFDQGLLAIQQDEEFLAHVKDSTLLKSVHGNFQLHSLKNSQKDLLATIPDQIYTTSLDIAPQHLSQFVTQDIVGPLSAVLENQKNNPIAHRIFAPSPSETISLTEGLHTIPPSNQQSGFLDFNQEEKRIEKISEIVYRLSNNLQKQKHTEPLLTDVSESSVLKIGDTLLAIPAVYKIPVMTGNIVEEFEEDSEILNQETIFQKWSQGDCNAYDNQNAISFSKKDDVVRLEAKNNHNACIYQSLDLEKGSVYRISVDYTSNAESHKLYIQLPNEGKIMNATGSTKTFRHEDVYFFVSQEGPTQIYLYSGENNATAVTEFSNIKLTKYKKLRSVAVPPFTTEQFTFSAEPHSELTLNPPRTSIHLPPLEQWSRSDCNAINDEDAIFFTPIEDNGIRLEAKNNHLACIYSEVPIESGMAYTVQFDARTKNRQLPLLLGSFDGGRKTLENDDLAISNNTWHQYSFTIPASSETKKALLHLYSGKTERGTTATDYRNVVLTGYPESYDSFTVFQHAENQAPPANEASIHIEKISPIAYRIQIDRAPGLFLFQLKEAFNTGWNLYPDTPDLTKTLLFKKPLSIPNYRVNAASNGWWIDLTDMCGKTKCQKNGNTESITFLVLFTPQRWFYVGTVITTFSIILLGVLAFHERKR